MASFHKHYATMQGQTSNGHPNAENAMTVAAASFSSDLAFLPPCDASLYSKTESPPPPSQSANYKAPSCSSLKSTTLKRKHSVMSRLFKHNHGLLLVHRLGKEKNVLPPPQRFSSSTSEQDEGHCKMSMLDNDTVVREMYTIANGYNVYSLHYPPPPQWPAATATACKSNRQHVHKDVAKSSFIASIVHSWKYGPAKQVYATKAVDELKEVVNEHHVWLQKAPATLVDVSSMAPRLFLEWPKNWAFSSV